jgi:tetratricopeptide (TPR) repeat protein
VNPKAIAHYEVLSSLGTGGMGEVYLARDTRLDRLVAIKLLPAEVTNNAARLRRFEQEARAVSALNHPNIVTIHEIGEAEVGRFIVLEYVKGQTLRSVIGGPQACPSIAPIGRQVATALGVAHDAGMVHRDIKPENVMVRDDGYVKVLDFGLARLHVGDASTDSTAETVIHTRPGTLIGTVAYMSPEQVKSEPVGSAADIFSLGTVFYEMATGRKPFRGASEVAVMYQIAHDQPPAPSHLNAAVPAAIEALVLDMLAKNPRLRPTAADVTAALTGGSIGHVATQNVTAHPPIVASAAPRIVGRTVERARLHEAYQAAHEGRGSILGITGEAGIGKTALVENFLAELRRGDPACLTARGRSSERLAGAEAYLPFLEAIDSLVRSTPPAARVMKATAPSWYLQLAASTDVSIERIMAEAQAASQERMKREMARFLHELSADRPLVLFFDDLHWADTSTVDILAYIATKVAAMRLLIVATYRRSEMLLHNHPFLAVALDMQTRGVCRELPLELLTREDVDRYLAVEFPEHRFPPQFGSLVYAKTEGNPLFMADVIRYLRDRGVIGEEDGRWALVQTAPEIETDLPETVRSMIQRKIARLTDVDRRLLVAASVQGYDFDSATVARALTMDPGDVEEGLQALDRVHGFAAFQREDELPDHTVTMRYRFVHVLYQNALYATLTPSRRASTSAAIAEALLGFYGDDPAEIASELAFLFQAARDWPRAAEYFLIAARNAARIFANQEAISLCRRGLEMNRRMLAGPERARQELRLQMTLGPSLMTIKGFGAGDTLRSHLRARELCEQLGDERQLFRVLFGLAIVSVVRAEYGKARACAEECLQLAARAGAPALLVQAHWVLGLSLQFVGEFCASRDHLQQSVALYDPEHDAAHVFLYGAILNRMHLARVLLYQGDTAQAQVLEVHGLREAETMRHPVGLCNAMSVAVTIEAFQHHLDTVQEMAERILFHADEHDLPYYAAIGRFMRGWARAMRGAVDEGCAEMRTGLEAHRRVETEQQRAYYLVLLAEALCAADRVADGLATLDEADGTIARTDERSYEAESWRIRGELLMRDHRFDEADAALRKALDVARSQLAAAFEARASASLKRLDQITTHTRR